MHPARFFLVFVFFCACLSVRAGDVYNFNSGWKLFVGDPADAAQPAFDDKAWQPVTLPRAFNEEEAFARSIYDLTTGIAWYRKSFNLPEGSNGNRVFLEFEGIRHGGEFFLNGKSIGRSDNGVMAFGFDVTDAIKPFPESNVIAARIDNDWKYREPSTNSPYQWNDRNFYANYGGINKNVKLHLTDQLHQTLPLFSNLGTVGVYVYATDIDVAGKQATVTVESQVCNSSTASKKFKFDVEVRDLDNKVVGTFSGGEVTLAAGETKVVSASSKLANLRFWSWGYGYLYTVTSKLVVDGKVVDAVDTRTGFRKTAFKDGMLYLNDHPLMVHGYAQRTTNEWPAVGISVPPWVSDFSNGLIVKSNGNLVRWMHVTPSKQDVESCDRVGLLQAMPAGDSERDATGRRWDMRVEVMRDGIIYNRNNPSIIFYESGNKGISEEHMAAMKAVRDQYDPHGGRAIGSREMLLKDTLAEYGGEMLYINKSAGKPLWATEYCRDEGARKYWDEFTPPYHKIPTTQRYRKPAEGEKHEDIPPAYEYNRNQDTFAIEAIARWYDYWRERPGTGTRVSGGGVNIIFSDSNTHFRGTENYRRSGEVDAMRLPKDAFFAHQIMWNGWTDAEVPAAKILGHWNYEPGVTKDVYVVSSAEKVELQLNGKSLGAGEKSMRFLFTFKQVQFAPGILKAIGYDASGKEVCTTEMKTAGAPVAIKLTAIIGPGGWRADGSDLALIDVEVVDANGQRCPIASNLIHFDLSGEGVWKGGIAVDEKRKDNFVGSKDLPVECGVNRVLIRSTREPGSVKLSARTDGLKSVTLTLRSQAVKSFDGLASELPQHNLPSMLDRGPTPKPAPVVPVREALNVAKVTAGSNLADASQTIDDDETTGWSSSRDLANAWIEYELVNAAVVSDVTLKLGNWRSKSYSLRIAVDGKVAFAGMTEKSLGYVTLSLNPTSGKTVRIELAKPAAAEKDGFDIVEVDGKKNPDSPTTQKSEGELSIIEAELYRKPENRASGMTQAN